MANVRQHMKRTAIPRRVADDPDALEAITAWIAGGRPMVSLNLSLRLAQAGGERDELESWGFLLGDVVHHVANALSQSTGYPREHVLQSLKARIIRELEDPTHTVTGQFETGGHDAGA